MMQTCEDVDDHEANGRALQVTKMLAQMPTLLYFLPNLLKLPEAP